MNASKLFKQLFHHGENALCKLRTIALKPELQKSQKNYNVSQACKLIGKSDVTLRNHEKLGLIPKARTIKKRHRHERVYNLTEINFLRDHYNTRVHKPKGSNTNILGVINFKGGSTKTYTAICQAQAFAIKGYRVLLIDCDSQGSTSVLAGMNPDKDITSDETLLDILNGSNTDLNSIIKKTHWDGLDLIPANLSLYNAEMIIPHEIQKLAKEGKDHLEPMKRLYSAIKTIEDKYDIIIFDTPPSVGAITTNVLYAANSLLIPIVPSIIDLSSTIQFLNMTAETLSYLPPKEFGIVKMLTTKHNHRKAANELHDVIKATFGPVSLTNYMIESEAITRAASSLQTLYEIQDFVGDKRTYTRAIDYSDRVNNELEMYIKADWDKQVERAIQSQDIANLQEV